MDGLEATRQVRQHWPGNSWPRIIAMTANVTKEDRLACFEAGMNDYLSKPIRVNELVSALAKCLPLTADAGIHASAVHPSAEFRSESSGLRSHSPEVSFDPSAVDRLRSLVGGDRAALSELITAYLDDTLKLLLDLRKALDTHTPDVLRRAGHSLKSSSRDFGALGLSALGEKLEALGKENRLAGAAELVAEAESAFEPVQVMLTQIRDRD
jgi:HPt (histidine-containing phosphotransfer) domain-containing protein